MLAGYNIGYATLAAGSAVMTGQGTLWLGNVRPGDLVVGYGNGTAIVGTVDSNTQITLTRPWRGTAQAAAVYEIVYTSDDVFAQALGRQVLQKISGSALMGLTSAVAAPRMGIRFDATSAASLFSLTDKALELLDDPDAAAMLTTLGAQAKMSGLAIPGGDYNKAIVSGIYDGAGAGAVNGPLASDNYGPLLVLTRAGAQVIQIAGFGGVTNAYHLSFRFSDNGGVSWTVWRSMLPEYASNSNGVYWRTSDGTQICLINYIASDTVNLPWGNLFNGRLWPGSPWPAAFTAAPDYYDIRSWASDNAGATLSAVGGGGATATTSPPFYLLSPVSGGTRSYGVRILGIGRWY
ncbi:MAG: hypothetical protein J0I98_14150 [Mesorhizobium sp.]|nr:hypothetical protein [Mesorhizobium sp.]MBN9243929.1 hypothetical protein [Mesorhizobium sp.]